MSCWNSWSLSTPSTRHLPLLLLIIVISRTSSLSTDIGIFFTKVPESRVVPPGDRVFFNCKTNIGKDEQIQWLHNGVVVDPEQRSDVRIANGQLSIKVRTAKRHSDRQTGRYQCVAGFENLLLTSEPASLSVAHLDKFPTTATSSSTSTASIHIEANEGNDVLLACTPPDSDPPAIVQWFKDGKLVNTSDPSQLLINLNHLLLLNVTSSQVGSYSCQASNHLTGASVLTPQPYNLTILPDDEQQKPRLLFEPDTKYHPVLGEDLTIPCSASGSPKPTIFWTHHAFNAPPAFMNGTHGLLQLVNVTHNSSGEYTCQIFNGRGRRTLRKTLVTVFEKPGNSISSFRNDPHKEGDPLELYCNVAGFPVPRIYWVVNGKRRPTAPHKLEIASLRLEDAGIYQCFAENDVGTSSAAVLLRVVPGLVNGTHPQQPQQRKPQKKPKKAEIVAPSAPNITQLSEDSVMVTWSMPNISQNIQFFKVQYRDLGSKEVKVKSSWFTVEGNIDPPIRSYEVAGLAENHNYRFRIAVVVDNDNAVGKVSPRFFLEKKKERGPAVIPQLQYILPLGPTSLSIQWTVPGGDHEEGRSSSDIEGYFIYFRESESAAPYNKITIFGRATHSHVIENLRPERQYDVKVRAFNVHGVSPFSLVQYQRTEAREEKKKETLITKLAAVRTKEEEAKDEDVTVYLILGSTLGAIFIVFISICSVVTLLKRRKSSKNFSETNAAIHNKYQDTSLQISGLQYDQDQVEADHLPGDLYHQANDETAMNETSFSATENSLGGENSLDSSQGSTALAQDSIRNLTYTQSTTPDIESLQEEYADEPSRVSWKRRRKSEEIL